MKSLDVNKNGFMSVYGLCILQVVLLFSSVYTNILKYELKNIHINEDIHYVELYAIQTVKKELLAYEEKDQTLTYLGFDILLDYEDITCYITIIKNGCIVLSSCLEWDDINNNVVNYGYVE